MKRWQLVLVSLVLGGFGARAVDLPLEVFLQKEVQFEVTIPDSAPFVCTLNPWLKVQLNGMEGDEVDITYIGRVKLSGVERSMFQGEVKEPTEAGPGRAVLADQAAMQLAGPDGERAGTVGLPKGGVVEVLAVRGDKLDIQLPLLRGKVPAASTDVAVRLEAARKAEAEREAEIDKAEAAKSAP